MYISLLLCFGNGDLYQQPAIQMPDASGPSASLHLLLTGVPRKLPALADILADRVPGYSSALSVNLFWGTEGALDNKLLDAPVQTGFLIQGTNTQ